MNVVDIDIMTDNGNHFYKSVQYNYSSLFKFDLKSMMSWLYDSLPSLKTKKDVKLYLDFPTGEKYELSVEDLNQN